MFRRAFIHAGRELIPKAALYNHFSPMNVTPATSASAVFKRSFSNVLSFNDIPGVKTPGEKLIMMYTCKVCDTRSVKKISKVGYNHGVVIVRCPCCDSKHLIADNLGVFEDKGWNIHDVLSQKEGEKSKYLTDDDVYELTVDDIIGKKHNSNDETSFSTSTGSDDAGKL